AHLLGIARNATVARLDGSTAVGVGGHHAVPQQRRIGLIGVEGVYEGRAVRGVQPDDADALAGRHLLCGARKRQQREGCQHEAHRQDSNPLHLHLSLHRSSLSTFPPASANFAAVTASVAARRTQSTRRSLGLGMYRRPALLTGRPSASTSSAVMSWLPTIRLLPTP